MKDSKRNNLLKASYLALITSVLWCATLPTHAADGNVFSLQIENDLFSGTDRNFTNGVRFAIAFENDKQWKWVDRLFEVIPYPEEAGRRRRITVALGQSMFTPEDIDETMLLLDDRPYAGWLYLGIGATVEYKRYRDSFEVEIGVIGPASIAKQTQDFIHDIKGAARAQGWANQLHNEPGFVAYFQRSWKIGKGGEPLSKYFDLTPHAGVALGNVFTFGAIGMTARVGSNLGLDFGAPPRVKPSLPGSEVFDAAPGLAWYIFAGTEVRAVARNIFLDGNTYRQSHSVDKRHMVADLQVGLALIYRRARLSITHVIRTDEFRAQSGGNSFGAVTLSLRF